MLVKNLYLHAKLCKRIRWLEKKVIEIVRIMSITHFTSPSFSCKRHEAKWPWPRMVTRFYFYTCTKRGNDVAQQKKKMEKYFNEAGDCIRLKRVANRNGNRFTPPPPHPVVKKNLLINKRLAHSLIVKLPSSSHLGPISSARSVMHITKAELKLEEK